MFDPCIYAVVIGIKYILIRESKINNVQLKKHQSRFNFLVIYLFGYFTCCISYKSHIAEMRCDVM